MRGKVQWMRRVSKMRIADFYEPGEQGFKSVLDFTGPDGLSRLGVQHVVDYPAYDNGVFYVIDTVKDVEWVVVGPNGQIGADHYISKYEAIEWADDFKAAWERNPPIEQVLEEMA